MNLIWFRTTCAQNGLQPSDEQIGLLDAYVADLLEWNKKINLISRRDEQNVWTRHILHCVSVLFRVELPAGLKILDLGTGGGLPGIVLKIVRPDFSVTLLDSTQKKINVVNNIVGSLGLAGIDAVWGRAEDLGREREHAGRYDVVVARAVAPLKDLIRWSYPFLKKSASTHGVGKGVETQLPRKRISTPAIVAFKGGNLDNEIAQLQNQANIGAISTVELTLRGATQLDDRDKKVVIVEYVGSNN